MGSRFFCIDSVYSQFTLENGVDKAMFWNFLIIVSLFCVSNINGAKICDYCNCVGVNESVEVKCNTFYYIKHSKSIDYGFVIWPSTCRFIRAYFQETGMIVLPK